MRREILRFAQNDKRTFSAASFSRAVKCAASVRLYRLRKKSSVWQLD
jgi:hypothetical protein